MKMNFDLHENKPVGETHVQMNGLTHEDSFCDRGKGQLGNGLLVYIVAHSRPQSPRSFWHVAEYSFRILNQSDLLHVDLTGNP